MMDIPKLTIITLNCRGLGNATQRRNIYHYLRQLPADIICLQETNTPASAANFWTQTWSGPAIWSRYTGLLLSSRHTLRGYTFSSNGRVLHADVSVRGHSFSLVNMYAPGDRPQRLAFFNSLDSSSFDPSQIAFIAGDWNCCPNPSVDRWPTATTSDHWSALAPTLSSFYDAALDGARQHYFTFVHASTTIVPA